MEKLSAIIVIPVFNDWHSLDRLIPEIDRDLAGEMLAADILIVNDGSSIEPELPASIAAQLTVINRIEILHLNCNLGHQRAVAVGLSEAYRRGEHGIVIVMDSDGEDRPEDIVKLIKEHRSNTDCIVVARRDKRSEGRLFKLGYSLYKSAFRILTGKSITFGNFSLIPMKLLQRLIFLESLWNHYPVTILRTKLPVNMVPTERGVRYAGQTKMNVSSLILLGLSAVAVYGDVALLRAFFLSVSLSVLTLIGIITVTIIRFYTELAIPGWASSVVGSLLIILVQSLIFSMFLLFLTLANRSQRMFVPAKHCAEFILKKEIVR